MSLVNQYTGGGNIVFNNPLAPPPPPPGLANLDSQAQATVINNALTAGNEVKIASTTTYQGANLVSQDPFDTWENEWRIKHRLPIINVGSRVAENFILDNKGSVADARFFGERASRLAMYKIALQEANANPNDQNLQRLVIKNSTIPLDIAVDLRQNNDMYRYLVAQVTQLLDTTVATIPSATTSPPYYKGVNIVNSDPFDTWKNEWSIKHRLPIINVGTQAAENFILDNKGSVADAGSFGERAARLAMYKIALQESNANPNDQNLQRLASEYSTMPLNIAKDLNNTDLYRYLVAQVTQLLATPSITTPSTTTPSTTTPSTTTPSITISPILNDAINKSKDPVAAARMLENHAKTTVLLEQTSSITANTTKPSITANSIFEVAGNKLVTAPRRSTLSPVQIALVAVTVAIVLGGLVKLSSVLFKGTAGSTGTSIRKKSNFFGKSIRSIQNKLKKF